MISIAIAGSTNYTAQCAVALASQADYDISLILTPTAKPSGRKKVLQENPLTIFAQESNIPTVKISGKITEQTKIELSQYSPPDYLFVADFGYWIPTWLQNWPKMKTLNIHPSALPRWRGSSPGQFTLLSGEQESAVSLIDVVAEMDAGEVYWQKKFTVEPTWTQTEYYDYAYTLAAKELPSILRQIHGGELLAKTQPIESPTPVARKLSREDGFVTWRVLEKVLANEAVAVQPGDLSELLTQAKTADRSISEVLETASRALSPWPQLWTEVPTKKGLQRMKIHSIENTTNQFELKTVQLAGQQPARWEQVKSVIIG